MADQREQGVQRRQFLGRVALAGTAGLFGLRSRSSAAEPPPETSQIRLIRSPDICLAPLYMAEELLQGEGFTDVQYVHGTGGQDDIKLAATGATDFIGGFVGRHLAGLDTGDPIVILAGLHSGCFELFGTQEIHSIRDLKGKQVAVTRLTSGRHIFLSVMAGYVGLAPQQDIHWVTDSAATSMQRFTDGMLDAFERQRHALERMMERNMCRTDALEVLLSGRLIEDDSDDQPFPSALFFAQITSRPLHVLAAFDVTKR